MTKVPYSLYCEARWNVAGGQPTPISLWSYLKVPMDEISYDTNTDSWITTEEIAHKVKLLASPHHKAIIRMMEIKNGRS